MKITLITMRDKDSKDSPNVKVNSYICEGKMMNYV